MGPGFGDNIASTLLKAITVLVIVAFMAGVGLTIVIPKLWHWLAPMVHNWTA